MSNQPKPPLQDRLAIHALRLKEIHALRLKEEAQSLRPGPDREAIIRRARQAKTASHVNEWLSSPGLQAPR
jgi:hypothetical protein